MTADRSWIEFSNGLRGQDPATIIRTSAAVERAIPPAQAPASEDAPCCDVAGAGAQQGATNLEELQRENARLRSELRQALAQGDIARAQRDEARAAISGMSP